MKAAAALILALAGLGLSDGKAVPVTKLDHESYSGRWFQMYTTKASLKLYEKHGQCITTDISINEAEATMSVLNTQTVNSTEAPFFRVTGTIYSTSAPGKFNVVFPPASWVDHTIVALGPLDGDGRYAYSIGTNHQKTDLFVLARDYSNWDEAAVLALIANYNLPPPVEVVQGQQCTYAKFLNQSQDEDDDEVRFKTPSVY